GGPSCCNCSMSEKPAVQASWPGAHSNLKCRRSQSGWGGERGAGVRLLLQSLLLQQAAQHPRGLFMLLHALCQQVGSWLIAGLVPGSESFAGGSCTGLVTLNQQRGLASCVQHAVICLDRTQFV